MKKSQFLGSALRRVLQRLVIAPAFLAVYLPASAADALPSFDIHFVVLTGNPAAQKIATVQQLRREVDILNEFFVTEARAPVVRFRYKGATMYPETRGTLCPLKDMGDREAPLDTDVVAGRFNACNDAAIRDPHAINFYVYDAYAADTGFSDQTGHGRRNSGRPFVFLDWQRLNHGKQAPEEHEMGHAFGLPHVCVPGATGRTPTNIMASADCRRGSGGLRNIGFDQQQVNTILKRAQEIASRLR
jgi:hypothetical protein